MALPEVQSFNLSEDSIKILGVHFTYNGDVIIEKNFCEVINNMENTLSTWRWRNMSLIGRITIFNSLAFSKIVFVAYLTALPEKIIEKN